MNSGRKNFRSGQYGAILFEFLGPTPRVAQTMYVTEPFLTSLIIVVNAVVVFHVLTFIVWAIIFMKDLLFETKLPVEEKKKK